MAISQETISWVCSQLSMGVLRGERESHIATAKEVLRRGW